MACYRIGSGWLRARVIGGASVCETSASLARLHSSSTLVLHQSKSAQKKGSGQTPSNFEFGQSSTRVELQQLAEVGPPTSRALISLAVFEVFLITELPSCQSGTWSRFVRTPWCKDLFYCYFQCSRSFFSQHFYVFNYLTLSQVLDQKQLYLSELSAMRAVVSILLFLPK